MEDLTKTRVFSSEDMRREMIRSNLKTVIDALNERGYNAVHQIVLLSIFYPLSKYPCKIATAAILSITCFLFFLDTSAKRS